MTGMEEGLVSSHELVAMVSLDESSMVDYLIRRILNNRTCRPASGICRRPDSVPFE